MTNTDLDRDGRTPLFRDVAEGRLDAVKKSLDEGFEVNMQDKKGWGLLHFAAEYQQPEIAQLLLKHGALVDIQDSYGNTPLSKAVFTSLGKGETIKVLLANGADRDKKNDSGNSPKKLAETIANYDVKQFL